MTTFAWLRILFFLALAYSGACLLLYFFQERLLFVREASDFNHCPNMKKLGAEAIQNNELRYFQRVSPQNKFSILFFHGNAGTACDRSWIMEGLRDLPINIIFLEYPGYAEPTLDHAPSEKIILGHADNLFDLFHEKTKIILMGESLGTGVATYLASRHEVSGLILQAPYTSIAEVAQQHHPMFPVRYLIRHPFWADRWAPLVEAPVLGLIAEKDEVIPPKISEKQMSYFKGNVQSVLFQDASHSGMVARDPELYWNSIREFIQKVMGSTL